MERVIFTSTIIAPMFARFPGAESEFHGIATVPPHAEIWLGIEDSNLGYLIQSQVAYQREVKQ